MIITEADLIKFYNQLMKNILSSIFKKRPKHKVKRKISCTKSYQRNRILIKIRNQLKKKYKKVREEE